MSSDMLSVNDQSMHFINNWQNLITLYSAVKLRMDFFLQIYKAVQCCDSVSAFASRCKNRSDLLLLYLHERCKTAFQSKAGHSQM